MATDPLSATFAALADPTRRAILARLSQGESSVTALAEPFQMSMPAVTKHLKVLEKAGLISRGRAKQWRPCKLKAQPLQDVANWVEQYRQFWEQRLDRLEAYLQLLQTQETVVSGPADAAPASTEAADKKPARNTKGKGNAPSKP